MTLKELLDKHNITFERLIEEDCGLCFINDLAIENGFQEPYQYDQCYNHVGYDIKDNYRYVIAWSYNISVLEEIQRELRPLRKKGDIPHPL